MPKPNVAHSTGSSVVPKGQGRVRFSYCLRTCSMAFSRLSWLVTPLMATVRGDRKLAVSDVRDQAIVGESKEELNDEVGDDLGLVAIEICLKSLNKSAWHQSLSGCLGQEPPGRAQQRRYDRRRTERGKGE